MLLRRLLCLVAILITAASAQAQFRVGLFGGTNFASLDDDDLETTSVDSRTLPQFGAILEYRLSSRLSLRTEPSFVKKGGVVNSSDGTDNQETEVGLSYLDIPLMLKFSAGNGKLRPYLSGGAVLGILLGTDRTKASDGVQNLEFDVDEIITNSDISLPLGAGLDYSIGRSSLFLQGRYNFGLSDIATGGEAKVYDSSGTLLGTDTVDDSTVTTSGIMISLGMTFPLGSR